MLPPLDLVYQDDCFVAINKPSGLLVHASAWAGPERESASSLLPVQLGRAIFPVHRLDRATSGVVVFAFASEWAAKLSVQFQQRRTKKEYLAIVRGHAPEHGVIDRPLEKLASEEQQDALTEYERLAIAEIPVPVDRYPATRFSLVRTMPKTGRMHQIRRHLRGISHPVINDTLYGDGSVNRVAREHLSADRLLLHARKLELAHPATGSAVEIVAPPPPDLEAVIARLGWQAAL